MDGWVDINWAQICFTATVYIYLQDCNRHIYQMSHMLLWEGINKYLFTEEKKLNKKKENSLLRDKT